MSWFCLVAVGFWSYLLVGFQLAVSGICVLGDFDFVISCGFNGCVAFCCTW